jgi:hypothetical protein
MNKFKNKSIFIVAILAIILGIIIYSNRNNITNLISTSTKDVYENNSSSNINYSCVKKNNKYILGAYEYNDSVSSGNDGYCVAGTEDTCIKTDCTEYGGIGACPAGTIIEYQVNNNDIYYFNVLHDDAGVMTLQSVDAITQSAWNESNDVTQGPITALTALTEATKNWSNVNDLNYSLGETIFLKYPNNSNNANPYTYCNPYNSCTSNAYTLSSSDLTTNVKARIISIQEAADLGCENRYYSCPTWISCNNFGIYTLSVNASSKILILRWNSDRVISDFPLTSTEIGIKAVVEINK